MPSWNHIYAAGDDIQDVAVYAMFQAAFAERGWAFPLPGGGPLAAGYDIQNYRFWQMLQFIDADTGDWGPTAVAGGPTQWVESVDYTGTPQGTPSDFVPITPTYVKIHAHGGNGWTRKYQRELTDLSATTYTDLSAFTDGDFARNLTDGVVYQRVTGTWVAAPTHFPDVVTAYGRIQPGDYIGAWLLNEVRDAVNLFLAFAHAGPFTIDNNPANHKFGQGFGSTVWATVQAATVASFAANPTANPQNGWVGTLGTIDNVSFEFSAVAYRFQQQFTASEPLGTGLAPDVDFYSFGGMLTGGVGDVFDANGDPVAFQQYTKFDTQTIAGGTATSIVFGGLAFPAWCANPAGGPQARGYGAGFTAVFRYDVAGGFTYRP